MTLGSGQLTAQMTISRFAGHMQKLRRTLLPPGLFHGLTGQFPGRLLRRVTLTNFIAVPLVRNCSHFKDFLPTMTFDFKDV